MRRPEPAPLETRSVWQQIGDPPHAGSRTPFGHACPSFACLCLGFTSVTSFAESRTVPKTQLAMGDNGQWESSET